MAEILAFIGENIATWWDFLWYTEVPSTGFSFGALYLFIIMFSIFVSVLSIIFGRSEDKK